MTHLELRPVDTGLDTFNLGLVVVPTAAHTWCSDGDSVVPVGVVRCPIAPGHRIHRAVSLSVGKWADRLVNWDVREIDADSADLSVEVTKVTAGQQGVVTEVHSRHNVGRAEGDLLNLAINPDLSRSNRTHLGKVIYRIAVEG
jgi:hypothetical protein